MKKLINYTVLLSFVLFTLVFPVKDCRAFSVGEERQVGEKLLYTVRSSMDVLDDPDLTQYVTKLGNEVLTVAGIQFFDYHFFVLNNNEFNAFAAPSGLVFFNSGLITTIDNENEFVSVMSHEIGHVVRRHISKKISQGKTISITALALVLASLALGGGVATGALFSGALAGGQSATLYYSRIDEEEADRVAYRCMKDMGRNPEDMVKMLQIMRKIERYNSAQVPQYLLTHPNPEARIDYIQSLIDTEPVKKKYTRGEDNTEFLRFKYRVLVASQESDYIRQYVASIQNNKKKNAEEKVMTFYALSLLDQSEKDYSRSLANLQKVIAFYPDTVLFKVDKGNIEYAAGRFKEAYETLRSAYNLNRENMYAAYLLGKVDMAQKKYDEAERLFRSVMVSLPQFADIYYELGRLSAIQHNEMSSSYYLGKMNLINGKIEPAEYALKKAVDSGKLPDDLSKDALVSLDLIKRLKKK